MKLKLIAVLAALCAVFATTTAVSGSASASEPTTCNSPYVKQGTVYINHTHGDMTYKTWVTANVTKCWTSSGAFSWAKVNWVRYGASSPNESLTCSTWPEGLLHVTMNANTLGGYNPGAVTYSQTSEGNCNFGTHTYYPSGAYFLASDSASNKCIGYTESAYYYLDLGNPDNSTSDSICFA